MSHDLSEEYEVVNDGYQSDVKSISLMLQTYLQLYMFPRIYISQTESSHQLIHHIYRICPSKTKSGH